STKVKLQNKITHTKRYRAEKNYVFILSDRLVFGYLPLPALFICHCDCDKRFYLSIVLIEGKYGILF
ncbi:hypothetical protein, partial [Proteiniphilum saccharofermentans]|uniref:hypothetical protein n=1 Tax=Proteiniphilum saccharofermentans TaxID=1642647 RepID=UPI0028A9C791